MVDWTDYLNNLANQLWRLSPHCRPGVDPAEVRLVAHRGAYHNCRQNDGSTILENTLPAFDRCLVHQIWGIELDIHLTLDGEPVVHHDPACGRLFNRPDLVIAETRFDDLRRALPAIPHLQEVISRYGKQLHLMIEVKESWRQRPQLPSQLKALLNELEPDKHFHLLSLEPDHLEGFRFLPPSVLIDVALTNTSQIVRQNLELGHGAVAGSFALLSTPLLQQLKHAGKQTGTGQVNHPDILNREANRGVDWIFSDQPLRLQCPQKFR
ncbi:glycerophosphodiester phosphodiesterase [Alkalimonas amylolytica]|uniref:Glycerophosphoryl diester phosphodiesterase n=1 Tax=Alkalimonas amylolytica TaxID=152573 RepID=A0A1H3Z7R6_ALKAM|nr:glycerophosphodiester phosphodiesterase [Alkalimonas amylolytica]SEA19700.1 glycerophosphoryl diester phosphodiesterase [Alkalimonas amylolytica]